MCNPERVMDWVISLSMMLVIWHNSLDGSIELMGYGTQKSMSYEIRTPNNKERAKSIREVQKCQKAAGYMIWQVKLLSNALLPC
jgi:hypothetical protein